MAKVADRYDRHQVNRQLEVIEYEIEGMKRELARITQHEDTSDIDIINEQFNLQLKMERMSGFLAGCYAMLGYIED